MEKKCKLSDAELIDAVLEVAKSIAKREPLVLRIPGDPNHDADLLLAEICERFRKLKLKLSKEEAEKILFNLFLHDKYFYDLSNSKYKIVSNILESVKIKRIQSDGTVTYERIDYNELVNRFMNGVYFELPL